MFDTVSGVVLDDVYLWAAVGGLMLAPLWRLERSRIQEGFLQIHEGVLACDEDDEERRMRSEKNHQSYFMYYIVPVNS